MAKALVTWLDQHELKSIKNLLPTLTTKTALYSHSLDYAMSGSVNNGTSIYCSKIHVYLIWIRTALSREYLASCKFDEQNVLHQYDDGSSEGSNITHSTNVSRMKAVHQGSVIMPFRADTLECVFLS